MKFIYNAPCGELLVEVERGEVCQCRWEDYSAEEIIGKDPGDDGEAFTTDGSADSEKTIIIDNLSDDEEDMTIMKNVISQLDEYFAGKRHQFHLPMHIEGTPFRKKVWQELTKIPYGKVVTYSELADQCGCPGGQRAVAQACSANNLPILIPCHRVVRSDGTLGGYTITSPSIASIAGKKGVTAKTGIASKTGTSCTKGTTPHGLAIKRFLLDHENKTDKNNVLLLRLCTEEFSSC